jgi:uncharacterized glyoxalase superfamily protein PhnB
MTPTIIPGFRYRDAPAAIEWLCRVFGFEKNLVVPGENGAIDHAQLTLGNGMIMLGSARDDEYGKHFASPNQIDGAVTQSIYVIVPAIDEHFQRARARGAEILSELAEQHYGGKLYTCRDLEGYLWNFGSYDPWAATSDA